MHARLQITSIRFTNYKAYKDYTVSLDSFNVLVGPNNAGKSTIIGALRILTEGLRRARSRGSDLVEGPEGNEIPGYPIKLEKLPVSTENVFHNYDDSSPAIVEFLLSNGNALTLFFPAAGHCAMIPTGLRNIRTPTDFKREFNVEVAFVPVLGPVEHNELLREKETARNALLAHSASRNFRNIWYHYPDGFDEFRKTVKSTWPGMDIQPPELTMRDSKAILCMFCPENRMAREMFWAGFGFQVWCQMLTFIVQARKASLLIIDEPDIYLHADLQRQLVGILKNLGPDIVVATHSVEMIMEVDSHALLNVNKQFAEARRIANTRDLQKLGAVLGTGLNATLAQLAKTRRVVFVEGRNYQIFSRLARVLGKEVVANRSEFAVIHVGGLGPEALEGFARQLESTLGVPLLKLALYDRGFRSAAEATALGIRLNEFCWYAAVQPGAGLENLVFNPAAVERAIHLRLAERRNSDPTIADWTENSGALFAAICEELEPLTRSQFPNAEFETRWANEPLRMVPGAEFLAALNSRLHAHSQLNFSAAALAQCLNPSEVWPELVDVIEKFDQARITQAED